MSEKVLIRAGARTGRTFDNESEFVTALNDGKQVFTERNGVYFEVEAQDAGVRYVALMAKPEGV